MKYFFFFFIYETLLLFAEGYLVRWLPYEGQMD